MKFPRKELVPLLTAGCIWPAQIGLGFTAHQENKGGRACPGRVAAVASRSSELVALAVGKPS
jgi:hypothetical protein